MKKLFGLLLCIMCLSMRVYAYADGNDEEWVNSQLLTKGVSITNLSNMSLKEKEFLNKQYQDPYKLIKMDSKEVDVFLKQTEMSEQEINELTDYNKCYIVKNLKEHLSNNPEEICFNGEKTVVKEIQPMSRNKNSASNGKIEIKVRSYSSTNNLQRVVIYPSFEWLEPPLFHNGTFVYRLHPNNWQALYTDFTLTIDGTINASQLAKESQPDFNCRQYSIKEYGNLFYEGIACYTGRARTLPEDNRICVGYAQNGNPFGSVTLGYNGISFTFDSAIFSWDLTREFTFDI